MSDVQKLIDARRIHDFLNASDDFTTWIQSRIEQYKFIAGVDYFTEDAAPGHEKYSLTKQMAKQLAMVENNDQGKEVRLYFIGCENFRERWWDLIKPRYYCD